MKLIKNNKISFLRILARFLVKSDPYVWHKLYFYYCRLKYFYYSINSKKNNFSIELKKEKHLVFKNLIPKNDLIALQNAYKIKSKNSNKHIIITKKEKLNKQTKKYVYLYDVFEKYTDQVKFLHLDDECVDHMITIYNKYMRKTVEDYFLCPSTIEDMWIYKSSTEILKSKDNYNYRWHYDGYPDTMIKIIFYISDVENKNGPFTIMKNSYANSNYDTKIKDSQNNYDDFTKNFNLNDQFEVVGKSGTTIFFNSALLLHRVGEIKEGERLVGSFSIRPNNTNNIKYNNNKPINAVYSKNPFLA